MADSTLDPDNTPEPDRKLGRGKGTSALGPGDISDSGSDVQGGVRRTGEVGLGLDTGTNEDPDSVSNDPSAGPDIGDAMLDSDTDAMGTGERATAGRDHELAGSDIDIDRIEDITPDDNPDLDELEHPDSRARQARDADRPAPRR
ncbi:MAG TPA: hypothetical protein VF450_19820 [Noviherbaspirillum sp.]|jgi:hypothetical protein